MEVEVVGELSEFPKEGQAVLVPAVCNGGLHEGIDHSGLAALFVTFTLLSGCA